MQLIAKVLLSQKSPCSYDCCHTFIEVLSLGAGNSDTHPLASMTEFSELGNGSQKVPCCDDWLQAGHWMLLNFAPDTLSIFFLNNCSVCTCVWMPQSLFSVTNNKGMWNNSLHWHFLWLFIWDYQKLRNTAILWECSRQYQSSVWIFTI